MTHSAVAPATFIELLRWRAESQPCQRAFSFLSTGGPEEVELRYAELDRQARALGAVLQSLGPAGNRALLLYPAGPEFVTAFFGCLYAGWIAVPAYPPPLNQRLARVQSIAQDARPALVLTTSTVLDRSRHRLASAPDLAGLRWLATDALPPDPVADWHDPHLGAEDLALLQYTSGSTGTPRGVMLSHRNLLHNTRQIERRFEIGHESRGVIWLPPFHDMGLIGGILQGVEGGFPITLMPPTAFLQRPARWLEAITRVGATISGGPNTAYDLCVERVAPDELSGLDLSSWEVAFNGSEPVRAHTLERFATTFAACGFRREAFYPCYGLAEATLMVSGGQKSREPAALSVQSAALAAGRVDTPGDVTLISCGTSIDDQCVVVVDPERMVRCPPGVVGEIWIAGPSVAGGYWGAPDLTRATFAAHLANTGTGPFLRTGDLGFVDQGELYVTGRLKAVMIINGRNVHAEDIEQTAAHSHDLGPVAGTAALSVTSAGRERLVIVQEVRPGHPRATLEGIARAIRVRVAEEHFVPVWGVVLTRPARIPRTSSGKVQRHACRDAFVAGHLEPLLEWELGPLRSDAKRGGSNTEL
jgi:acyl-CoA synthetase (AMP-forming)/AMP-acid ligase II